MATAWTSGRPVARSTGPLWLLVACFAALTLWRSAVVGIEIRDPGGQWLLTRVLWTLLLLAVLVPAEASWRAGSRAPAAVWAAIRERWRPARIAVAGSALAAYHTTYLCYHNLKSWNAFRTVHDDWLASADRLVFLGHSPAVLLHTLIGTGSATWVLIGIYQIFPIMVAVSIAAAVVLPTDIARGVRVLTATTVVWMFGTLTYYAIPSIGPFHFAPGDFAILPESIVTRTQAGYLAERARLLADPGAADAHAQIAAFASLHVGVSATLWLATRRWLPGLLDLIGGLTVFLTAVATVQVGWHFVMDDIAGLLIAWLSVRCADVLAPVPRDPAMVPT